MKTCYILYHWSSHMSHSLVSPGTHACDTVSPWQFYLMAVKLLQWPFFRCLVTPQLWVNFTLQSSHLNGLPSAEWWSFSCFKTAFSVVNPFLHWLQWNCLVSTFVGWHLELICNSQKWISCFFWFLQICSPDACAVAGLALWNIHTGRRSRVGSCLATDGSCTDCSAC